MTAYDPDEKYVTLTKQPKETKTTGGPAFPGSRVFDQELYEALRPAQGIIRAKEMATSNHGGMSLRDYFAGQALAGGLAYCGDGQRGSWHNNATPEAVAAMCYEYADAMLSARGEG